MGIVATIPESAVDYVLYGDKSHIVGEYLRNQLSNIPQVFNNFTNRIYQAVQQSYHYVTDNLVKHALLNHLSNQGVLTNQDLMRDLWTFEQLQQATPVMQRWVMAHPEVKRLYQDQNIDGYSNTYTNVFGSGVGEQDYNWRRIMTGVPQEKEDGTWIIFYNDNLIDGDRELSHSEKAIAISTHEAIDFILKNNPFDFTCTSEALVKINWS